MKTMASNNLETACTRLAEASTWAGLAAALWGAVGLLPAQLDGAFGLSAGAWQAIIIILALGATVMAIRTPEGAKCGQ